MHNKWKDSEIIININISVICYFVVFLKILYRLLRADEDPAEGLTAKNPNSDVNVNSHVLNGSYGPGSRYISCSKTLERINEFASRSITFPRRIVRIEINENDPDIKRIIDLTNFYELSQHVFTQQGINFARKFDEVLVEGRIRAECITFI